MDTLNTEGAFDIDLNNFRFYTNNGTTPLTVEGAFGIMDDDKELAIALGIVKFLEDCNMKEGELPRDTNGKMLISEEFIKGRIGTPLLIEANK